MQCCKSFISNPNPLLWTWRLDLQKTCWGFFFTGSESFLCSSEESIRKREREFVVTGRMNAGWLDHWPTSASQPLSLSGRYGAKTRHIPQYTWHQGPLPAARELCINAGNPHRRDGTVERDKGHYILLKLFIMKIKSVEAPLLVHPQHPLLKWTQSMFIIAILKQGKLLSLHFNTETCALRIRKLNKHYGYETVFPLAKFPSTYQHGGQR